MHNFFLSKTKRNQCNDTTETNNTYNIIMTEVGYDKFLYDKIVNPDSMDKHEALPCITRKTLIKKKCSSVQRREKEKKKKKKRGGGGGARLSKYYISQCNGSKL